jgi:hypothetical protein
MKKANLFAATLLLAGSLSASSAFAAAEGVISNATLSSEGYCHLKFPAIREDTLSWDRPVLKDAADGDIIDFYGPCNHDPRGLDEIESQRSQVADQYDND